MPDQCDPEVFERGVPVLLAGTGPEGGAAQFEEWVRELSYHSGARCDWHYSGGVAQVLTLGDAEQVTKVARTHALPEGCRVLRWVGKDERGAWRSGVSPAPEGAVAVSVDLLSGEQVFIVPDVGER